MTDEIIKNPNLTLLLDESLISGSQYEMGRAEILPPPHRVFHDIIRSHIRLLSNMTPGITSARPIIMVRTRFPENYTENSSNSNLAATQQYELLEKQLVDLGKKESDDDEVIEKGAIDTARKVVSFIRSRQIAPPALSGFGPEAIIMLWVLGHTRFALTVTDGELGYVVRRGKDLVRKKPNLKDNELDILMLRDER